MTGETIFVFIMALILLWIKPGPGQALKITRTLNDGFWSGLFIVLGIITACLIFFLVAAIGASFVTNIFNSAGVFLKIIGGTYLIYIGIKALKNIKKGQWQGRTEKAIKKNFIENYSLGLVVPLANPLPIFFFLSILPTLVPVGTLSTQDIIIGLTCIITVGLIVDILLLLLVHQAKEALSETNFVKRVNILAGGGFLLIGLFLLFSAIFLNDFSFEF
jgi:threonine/homoserine/homoserine lactone efflux protein